MPVRACLTLVALVLTAGCSLAPRAQDGGARSVITRAELDASDARDLYRAVEMLRPEWLTSRGPASVTDPTPTTANVYSRGNRVGGLEALRQIEVGDVREVRFWPSSAAAVRFGMDNPRGVIEITPRGG